MPLRVSTRVNSPAEYHHAVPAPHRTASGPRTLCARPLKSGIGAKRGGRRGCGGVRHAFGGEHPELGAIVRGLLDLAERSGIETIAEGIETGAQLGQLRDQNCELGQGYFFARPLPLEQAEALLERAPTAA